MSRRLRIGSILTLLSTLVFYFVNCAGGLPGNLDQKSAAGASALSLSINPAQITPSETASAVVTGGTPPYSFSVVQGTATIDSLGFITKAALGTVQIKVVDGKSATALASLDVSTQTPGPAPSPLPAPSPPPSAPAIVCDNPQSGLFQQGTLTASVPATTEAECLAGCAARGAGICDYRAIAPYCYWTPAGNVSLTTATPYWVYFTCH